LYFTPDGLILQCRFDAVLGVYAAVFGVFLANSRFFAVLLLGVLYIAAFSAPSLQDVAASLIAAARLRCGLRGRFVTVFCGIAAHFCGLRENNGFFLKNRKCLLDLIERM